MTQEKKQLLLKDLCARLPYGVMCNIQTGFVFEDGTLRRGRYDKILDLETVTEINDWYENDELEKLKPYLRPMSSMTEKEKKEFDDFCVIDEEAWKGNGIIGYINQAQIISEAIDFLNSHHFDFCGLLEKGLALEAPEGMYNTKTE